MLGLVSYGNHDVGTKRTYSTIGEVFWDGKAAFMSCVGVWLSSRQSGGTASSFDGSCNTVIPIRLI
jgi:hypothetical protein